MAEDLHENKSNAGVRILGGDFEVKKLKREIRIFGQKALTDLKIKFEQIRPREITDQSSESATRNTVTDQIQKFVFPFSEDKNLTYFRAKYIKHDGTTIQTLATELKEKKKARDMYQESVSTGAVGAIVTTAFESDEYTIEMGNKPKDTKYIEVELKYFETMKTEYRSEDRLFTMLVPRHKKRRYNPMFDNDMDVDDDSEIFDSSKWVDEIEIIEPLPNNTCADPAYQILNIEWDDKRWEIDSKDGKKVVDGRKWSFYEINEGVPSEARKDIYGNIQPDIAPKTGQAKNDLEVRFFMKSNVAPAINIEYMDASESEAIVSIELSEDNLRKQMINLANVPLQDLHSMEYDSNATPGASVVSAQPMEFVFLIDCSGSMSGTFMENTRKTMDLIMKSIDIGSKVIFCRFGSRYIFDPPQNGQPAEEVLDDDYYPHYHRRNRRPLRVPEMRDANWIAIDDEDDEQEETIKNLIANFSASLGGTDIREPLADILQLRQEPGVYRNIVVLTDGAVSNTEEVHELVKNEAIKQEGYLRFFALGIGNSASRSLCDGIAKHGRGSSVYVLDNDRIQAKASLILENASRPSVYLQKIALPSTLEVLGHSFRDPLDMSVFGFERIYLRLKSRNNSAVFRNLVEGVENGAFHLIINREPILMRNLDHTMQPWYNSDVKLTAFWAKQEINYLKDAAMDYEERKRIQVEASINGGTLCDHTAFVGVMYRVGQERQEQAFQIQHEGSNTSSSEYSSYNSGYMAASASSGPFGRPPASGGIGGAYWTGTAMFSGVSMAPMAGGLGGRPPMAGGLGGPPPMAGGLGGRPPMAGGIGGVAKGGMSKSFGSSKIDTIISKRSKKRSKAAEKLPNLDKLMSLVKTNGLWPASEGKAVLGCLMKYNKNFDKIFEDLRSRMEAVDLILTLMVLAALEKYEMNNQIEWARISSKAKTKLSKKNIDADAEIKALSMIL